MRGFIPASFTARFVLLGGLLLVILVSARPAPEFLSLTEALAAPVVHSPGSVVQSGCPTLGGKQLTSTNGRLANVLMYIGLGHLAEGRVAEIGLRETEITADIYTPEVLGFSMPNARNGAEMIPDDSRPSRRIRDRVGGYLAQPLRQVKVPETLLDIIVSSPWEYELRFYHPDQVGAKRGKLYELVGEPYAVYRFRNPNPPSANRLEITMIQHGKEDKSEYFYDPKLDFWSLTTNGQEVVRKRSEVNPGNPCELIETRLVTADSKVVKTVRIFKGFPWGQEIVKKIEDPEGEAKTTTFQYFEDRNGPHYSFLKTTIHPDGHVEQHNQQPDPTMRFRKKP